MNKKHYKVVGAIIEYDGKILCMQRPKGKFPSTDLKWEFPGGKIEPGETPQQALIREIREELDTTIEVGDLIATVEHTYPEYHVVLQCFWAKVVDGALTLREHEAARWLSKSELGSVKWLGADIDLFKKMGWM